MSEIASMPWVKRRGRWLEVSLPQLSRGLSWALVGGGFSSCSRVVWWQVTSADLPPSVDPQALLRQRLQEKSWDDTIAMMTSRRLDRYVHCTQEDDDLSIDVVATVGLSNGMAVGDPATYRPQRPSPEVPGTPSEVPGTSPEGAPAEVPGFPSEVPGTPSRSALPEVPGTINIHCHVSWPLGDAALVEGLALAAEARTAALLEEPMGSTLSDRPVTGTGTDCIAITCPIGTSPQPYAGKHGVVGATLGQAVREAISRGRKQWELDRAQGQLDIPLESERC